MKHINLIRYSILSCIAFLVVSCQQPGGNSPGSEYMADMGHSVSYEANTYDYYSYNRWGGADEYHKFANPRLPVKGTIPRGESGGPDLQKSNNGLYSHGGISIPVNGSSPYYYGNTEEERTRAMAELTHNPLPISSENISNGKEMYDLYCGICHGDKADGAGYLVREDGGKYPVQPANFLLPDHINSSNGRYYHAIMFGKNLMGSYKDKLSTNERWQVIQYIRSLQAKELNLVYNEDENTLNETDMPLALMEVEEEHATMGDNNEHHVDMDQDNDVDHDEDTHNEPGH